MQATSLDFTPSDGAVFPDAGAGPGSSTGSSAAPGTPSSSGGSAAPSAPSAPSAPAAPAGTNSTPPPARKHAPVLQPVAAAPALLAREGLVTTVSAAVSVDEPALLRVSLLANGKHVVLGAGTRVAGVVTGRPHALVVGRTAAAGVVQLRLRVGRGDAKRRTFRLVVTAVGPDGRTSTVVLPVS